jgi:hypothetical protein
MSSQEKIPYCMKRRILFFIFLAGLVCHVSTAQLLQWNTFGNTGTETTEPSVANNANIAAASLSMSGLTTGTNGNRFGGSTWGTSNPSTLAEAIANNDYIQFTVTPTAGYSFTPTSFVFIWDRSSSGPPNAALRSSADGYAADLGTISGVVSGAFATQTITISGLSNITTATTFRIYGYGATGSTGTGGFDTGSNAVNVTLNGTTTASSAKVSNGTGGGDWNTASTWNPVGVPANGDSVTILSGDIVSVAAGVTRAATTTVNGNFQINTGGSVSGTAFTYAGSGGLIFNSNANYGVNNTDPYWPTTSGPINVSVVQGGFTLNSATRTLSGNLNIGGSLGVNFSGGSQLTVNGSVIINLGGFVGSNALVYGPASTLQYNSGVTYGRGFEWYHNGVGTIGTTPGYPNNVSLTNSTTLDYVNTVTPNAVLDKALAGNLTINTGSTFNMNTGGIATGGDLYVGGNLTLAGSLTLGAATGDDMRIAGNMTVTGSFNGNNRAVWFYKSSGTQTITATSGIAIPYVVFDSTGNRTVLQAASTAVTITAPLAGNAISFGSASDIWSIGASNTLTIGTAAVANTISGTGTFSGTTTSNLTLQGTGSFGTIRFTSGSQNLGTFKMDRSAAAVGCVMGSALTAVTLNLTSGHIDLGANTMNVTSTITGGSANSYVIADNAVSGVLQRTATASATLIYPIGDRALSADGSQYSPVTIVTPSGTFTGASISASVNDIKHPSFDATSEYITRYWNITTAGTMPASFTANATYLDVDVFTPAQEANYIGNKWNGALWSNGGSPVDATNNLTLTVPCTSGATNQITAGRRDPDINVYAASVVTNTSGWTYDFGNVLVGNNSPITFTIQNIGQQGLNLAAPSTSPAAPYSLSTAYTTGNLSGPTGTRTFVVTFTPTAGGTFTGSIVIPSNDPDESSYTINFTGVGIVPAPEIDIRGNSIPIAPGNTPTGLDNTLWTGQTIGTTSAAKTFEIYNTGTAALTLTGSYVTLGGAHPGDWTIATMPSNSIAVAGNTTFTVTFTPTLAGTRTATLSVYSNDSDEPIYTWNIQGSGTCTATANTITPQSGPAGTEVLVTATTNNLTGATATLNGVALTVTPVDATHVKVIIPAGAQTGNLITTNATGCTASNLFTVFRTQNSSCQGGNGASDLFISEVTDATSGGLTYVEIFNGTANPILLSNYSVLTFSNANAAPTFTLPLANVTLNSGSIYVVALGDDDSCSVPGGDGSYAAQTSSSGGINFDVSDNDYIALYGPNSTTVDSFGVYMSDTWADGLGLGDRGAVLRRNPTATLPSATYNSADWTITNWAGSGAGSCSTNDYSNIGTYTFTPSIPPTVTQNPSYTPSCKSTSLTVAGTEGFAGGNALAYQWYFVAPNATTWTALTNTGVYSGVTTATLNISNIAGLDGYQFYAQIRENGATCYAASNAIMITEAITCTWDGTSWSPSAPTINSIAVINGPYNTTTNGNIDACSVVVNSPNTLTVTPNGYVNIQNDLTVNSGATVQVQDDGSLVMIDDAGVVTNNGTTQIVRTTSPYNKYDYTYWSSPVAAATIGGTFTGWRTDYAFHFVTSNFADISPADGFDDDQNAWVYQPPATVMTKGKGYAIMAPTTGTFPTTNTVTFSGAANNGIVNILLAASANGASATDDFNLIGNPYPSAIYANDFINANTNISGTLYFWTHRTGISNSNPGPDANNFITADYAMYNLSGGTSSGTGSPVPTGYIASGEGFFVEANAYTNVLFNNAMRSKTYNNAQFYRPANNSHASVQNVASEDLATDKDRLWLNLESPDGLFSQQLLAYFDQTTLDFDRGYDGLVSKSNATLSFYSFIGDDKYRIQARPAFSVNDVVPLGYSSTMNGTYTIGIGDKEGQLDYADTNIYLEDKLLGIIHDLKQAPYTFTTAVGTFNDRFILRYLNSALGTDDIDALQNNVAIAVSNAQINAKSFSEPIQSIAVYDILGRRLFANDSINAREFAITGVTANQQTLIVKVKLENGAVINRKIVF